MRIDISKPTEIIIEVRSQTKQADGAAILSLYLYPRLDPDLKKIGLGEALWWIPRMRKERVVDIFMHVGAPVGITLGALKHDERRALAGYLDDMKIYSKQNKGSSVA